MEGLRVEEEIAQVAVESGDVDNFHTEVEGREECTGGAGAYGVAWQSER